MDTEANRYVETYFSNDVMFVMMPCAEAFSALGAGMIVINKPHGSFVYVRNSKSHDSEYWRCIVINGRSR